MSPAYQLREAGLTAWWLRTEIVPLNFVPAHVWRSQGYRGACGAHTCRASRRNQQHETRRRTRNLARRLKQAKKAAA